MSKIDVAYKRKELPDKFAKIGGLLLAVGVLTGAVGFFMDPSRSIFSYLTSFMFLLSIGIGSLFLVALEYIAGADWSTPFRRISEFLSSLIPLLFILIIPLLFSIHDIFHWSHKEVVETDKILKSKAPYLNDTFFIVRSLIVLAIWTFVYLYLIRNSRKQDETRDPLLTKRSIVLSGAFMPIFAITITIMAVDWLMSLEPHWFSTIFGVYYFAGSVWCALAAITLFVVHLHEGGYLHPRINTDHYYSLGTLMFAFTCFWGYIAFSQYMLIWYADLPEESFWFLNRWEGGWIALSIVLVITHFIVPFFALLSHKAKTNPGRLKFMAVWILAAHIIDLYWLIMPNISNMGINYYFSWVDISLIIAAVGLVMVVFNYNSKKYNLIPVGDPKLERGLDFSLHQRDAIAHE